MFSGWLPLVCESVSKCIWWGSCDLCSFYWKFLPLCLSARLGSPPAVFPFPSFPPWENMKKVQSRARILFRWMRSVMKSENWMAALGCSLSSEALSLQRDFLIKHQFEAAHLKLSSLSLNATLSDWLLLTKLFFFFSYQEGHRVQRSGSLAFNNTQAEGEQSRSEFVHLFMFTSQPMATQCHEYSVLTWTMPIFKLCL